MPALGTVDIDQQILCEPEPHNAFTQPKRGAHPESICSTPTVSDTR